MSERDAREVQRLLRLLTVEDADQVPWSETELRPSAATHTDNVLNVARAVLLSRQARKAIFASSIFGEPAWDMLLTLYVAEREEVRLTISRLAELSDARLTTALRWIDYLDQSGLIARRGHSHDARVVLIELTEQAIEKMETYFRGLLDSGYAG